MNKFSIGDHVLIGKIPSIVLNIEKSYGGLHTYCCTSLENYEKHGKEKCLTFCGLYYESHLVKLS